MGKKITIQIEGKEFRIKPGISIQKLLDTEEGLKRNGAIGAIVNNRLMGLYYVLHSDCTIRLITYFSKAGAIS